MASTLKGYAVKYCCEWIKYPVENALEFMFNVMASPGGRKAQTFKTITDIRFRFLCLHGDIRWDNAALTYSTLLLVCA